MDDRDRCRDCGEKRPADAPEGLCSACLLRTGLAGGAPQEASQVGHDVAKTIAMKASPSSLAATSEPGALARLAKTLVEVPRVHLRDDEPFSDSGPVVRPSSPEMPDPSERLARLQLLGEVARGGMGVARAADSDAFRNRLRALVERPDIRQQGEALRALSQDRQVAELPPTSILQLASALREAGDPAAAAALLESAAQRYPDDVWINYHLAESLSGLPARREEAVRYYTAARALRPESAHNLGHLLEQMGRGEDAIATFRALVKLRPGRRSDAGPATPRSSTFSATCSPSGVTRRGPSPRTRKPSASNPARRAP